MSGEEVLRRLESLGTAQNRKIYRRHGAGEKLFGVSFANLEKLKKEIKVDHELAQQLWASGNHDARVLAAMIADPAATGLQLLNAWKRDLDGYIVTDIFSGFVEKTAHARKRMELWTRSKEELTGRAGWLLLARIARNDESLPDSYFLPYLETIERTIHTSKNRVRDAMNSALIAIGIRSSALEKKAIAAARRIGKVEVDHGETGCKTPDAEAYILKALQRKRSRASG
jgi:3-methyladenine DNA glycosylase AlkD